MATTSVYKDPDTKGGNDMIKCDSKPWRLRRAAPLLAILGIAALALPARAVVLDSENLLTVNLRDGTIVTVLGEAPAGFGGGKTSNYYYLPTNLKLSTNADGTPQFLFLKFITEEKAGDGGIGGGLIHFLMEWGLTDVQVKELEALLKVKNRAATVKGAAPVEALGEAPGFQIISGVLTDKGLTPTIVATGKAPLMPGGKIAAAARLTPQGAQILEATFQKTSSISDISINLDFAYTMMVPAAKGRIIFDWSKLETEFTSLRAKYTRNYKKQSFLFWSHESEKITESYAREQFDFLSENQVIIFEWQETLADERLAKIRDAFVQYFLNMMAEPAEPEPPPPAAAADPAAKPDIKKGTTYKFSETSFKRAYAQKRREIRLDNYRLSVKKPYTLTENMTKFYDRVRNNPKCIGSIILNDPFYTHRDIHFNLDLSTAKIFDDAVNYVTVNVRKRRTDGRPFETAITIDSKHLKEKGKTAQVTYARGDDTSPDVYEYKVQWSMRDGLVFPKDAEWQKGDWQGVTLSPPLVPRSIEFEGDLDALKSSDITRVTAQVRYFQLGKEVEENIPLSAAAKEPSTTKTMFADKDAKGYAYRLVLNHKKEGKLALPWQPSFNDNYIYATIPEDLLKDDKKKDDAKKAAETETGTKKETVLDDFKQLLGER